MLVKVLLLQALSPEARLKFSRYSGTTQQLMNEADSYVITRASFCCSNKARKLHLFSAKIAFMRCKLHLCAHLTVKDLKQPILHAKIEKVAKSNMQKSKKLQKVACNRKSCKSNMQKSKKLQKVAI